MKYMTLAWWNSLQQRGGGAEKNAPLMAYKAHYDKIEKSLTASLSKFLASVRLHDANFRGLKSDPANHSVTLNLWIDEKPVALVYSGVSHFEIIYQPGQGLRASEEFGDLGYDEVDVKGKKFEHRLLFSTGVEFVVEFDQFQFQ
jgi:hypothetical protein